jgi:small membrane protein
VTIKLLLLVCALLAAGFAYRGAPSSLSLATRRVALLLTLFAAVVAIVSPEIVTWIANLLGVGRGTDLVLYGLVIASFFVWIGLYRRLHEMEHRFVDLSRAMALDRATDVPHDDEVPRAAQPVTNDEIVR